MSHSPWHKRFHGDALNGYMGLTLEERGAYTTLLDLMYERGEALVDNERFIAGWLQVSVRKYHSIRARLIEIGKILVTEDGRLSNSRFERERQKALETSRTNSVSGEIGGRKSGEARQKSNEINESAKRSLQKNEAISEAQKLEEEEGSSNNSENFINVVAADAAQSSDRYAFEAKTIKLNGKDLEKWRSSFPHLSLEAELQGMDEWAGQQRNWYAAVSGALAKKERAVMTRIHMARVDKEAGPSRRSTPDPRI